MRVCVCVFVCVIVAFLRNNSCSCNWFLVCFDRNIGKKYETKTNSVCCLQ